MWELVEKSLSDCFSFCPRNRKREKEKEGGSSKKRK